jgi:glycosyltransferase involved in cell wall biosynthesis
VRIRIVSLYFPPAGGPGVQRPLKLSEHLSALGFEVHVLAPDDPKWVHRDTSLRVPHGVAVHRARNLGPRARIPAQELHGRRGLGRLRRRATITARGLLPDASVLWSLTAVPAALRIVRRDAIDVVLTTSPPGFVHLVGAAARVRTRTRWVADLRDPIDGHAHRRREGRGRAVLTAKVFEYLAAERPILAAVPPDGHAAELIRETGPGPVVPPDDVDALAEVLGDLERRWRDGSLDGSPLTPEQHARLVRRAGAERLAEILREVAG